VGKNVWLLIWVDDILVTGAKTACDQLIENLKKEFNAKNFGLLKDFFGTKILQNGEEIKISQSEFIDKLLSKLR
jgi:hypothetical protein